jgi:hypothetical protein
MSPLDTTDWKSDNNELYELTMLDEPTRLDRSSCTKLVTVPTAPPPPPPPPQAVSANADDNASKVFFNFLDFLKTITVDSL